MRDEPPTSTDDPRASDHDPRGSAIDRRSVLRAGAAVAGSTALAGCLGGLFETRSARSPPLVENRPKAVYIPTHVDGMSMVEMGTLGPYRAVVSFSFPHRFWLITGQNREEVTVQSDDTVHLMTTLVDAETGIGVPNGNVSMEITKDGETVDERSLWPMLSQRMGFHFGDNVGLEGDGTYEITATADPLSARQTGAFQGRFDERAEASFTMEFSQSDVEDLSYQPLEEKKGQAGAVRPMQMEMLPVPQLPKADALPGELLGEVTSADGKFAVVALDSPPAGVEGDGAYLAVSARTPYHRYPLPFMGLSASITREGSTVFDGALKPTIHPDLNYHYGAAVDAIESGDTVELSFGAPPQVARHEGYETAFFEFEDGSITVS